MQPWDEPGAACLCRDARSSKGGCGRASGGLCLLAMFGLMASPPDVVISGINHGANLGSDVIFSGTVAGARQAALQGVHGMASSLVDGEAFGAAAKTTCQVAKALAAKRRESVGVNRELVALGAANLGAAFTGGFPVTGGFSRSVVNDSAGANTPLAGIITAALMGLVVVLMTPVFFFLPTAALAAVRPAGVADRRSAAACRRRELCGVRHHEPSCGLELRDIHSHLPLGRCGNTPLPPPHRLHAGRLRLLRRQ